MQTVGWKMERAEEMSCRRILEVHILTPLSPSDENYAFFLQKIQSLPLCCTDNSLSLLPLHIHTRRSPAVEPERNQKILQSSSENFFTSRTRCSWLIKERGILHSVELHSCMSQLSNSNALQWWEVGCLWWILYIIGRWWCPRWPGSWRWHQRQFSSCQRKPPQSCSWSRCRWWRWSNRSLCGVQCDKNSVVEFV